LESPQGKPLRKRRRWPGVAFILVLVSFASWWCWPRGDARFVGKWQIVRDDGPIPAFMIFGSNGGGRTVDASGRSTSHFSWEFDGLSLLYRPPFGLKGSARLTAVSNAMQKYLGTTFLHYEERAEVLTLTEDMLATRLSRSGNSFKLKRTPSR